MARRAFSLIEFLTVVSILGILIGLLLPAVQSVRASAAKMACQNSLKQIGLAMHNYESANGRLPSNDGKPISQTLSWMVRVLPYLDQGALFSSAVAAAKVEPDYSLPPHTGFATPVKFFGCAADSRLATAHAFDEKQAAYSSYLGIRNVYLPSTGKFMSGVVRFYPGIRIADITDGTSGTVAVVERPPPATFQAGWWYGSATTDGRSGPHTLLGINSPPDVYISDEHCNIKTPFGPGRLDNPCDRFRVWSLHPAGANFLFADGAVRFLGYGFASILPAAATISGGEVLPSFE